MPTVCCCFEPHDDYGEWRRRYGYVVTTAITAVDWEAVHLEDRTLVTVVGGSVDDDPKIVSTYGLRRVECLAFVTDSQTLSDAMAGALTISRFPGKVTVNTDAKEVSMCPLALTGFIVCGVFVKICDTDDEEAVRNWRATIDAPVACTNDEEHYLLDEGYESRSSPGYLVVNCEGSIPRVERDGIEPIDPFAAVSAGSLPAWPASIATSIDGRISPTGHPIPGTASEALLLRSGAEDARLPIHRARNSFSPCSFLRLSSTA